MCVCDVTCQGDASYVTAASSLCYPSPPPLPSIKPGVSHSELQLGQFNRVYRRYCQHLISCTYLWALIQLNALLFALFISLCLFVYCLSAVCWLVLTNYVFLSLSLSCSICRCKYTVFRRILSQKAKARRCSLSVCIHWEHICEYWLIHMWIS